MHREGDIFITTNQTCFAAFNNIKIKLAIRYVEHNLIHSQVHNKQTVPIIMAGCIAHAQNGDIFTGCQKSVNIKRELGLLRYVQHNFASFGLFVLQGSGVTP